MDVPEKLKRALFEKGWSQKKLCGELGITENGLKNMIDRNSWKLDTVEKIASALGLSLTYFLTNSEENMDYRAKSQDGGAFGEKTINNMAAGIEELKELFEEELSAKNQQIASLLESQKNLQRMLENILGKFKGATFTQLSEEEMFNLTMDMYRQAGLSQVLSPLVSKPRRFEMFTPAKSVALSSFR